MVDEEWQARADKRFNRLMKEAHLRYPAADLDETIYRPERQLDTQTIERLSTCHWIEEGKNLIVTGSSASGKTYLINAFCVKKRAAYRLPEKPGGWEAVISTGNLLFQGFSWIGIYPIRTLSGFSGDGRDLLRHRCQRPEGKIPRGPKARGSESIWTGTSDSLCSGA